MQWMSPGHLYADVHVGADLMIQIVVATANAATGRMDIRRAARLSSCRHILCHSMGKSGLGLWKVSVKVGWII